MSNPKVVEVLSTRTIGQLRESSSRQDGLADKRVKAILHSHEELRSLLALIQEEAAARRAVNDENWQEIEALREKLKLLEDDLALARADLRHYEKDLDKAQWTPVSKQPAPADAATEFEMCWRPARSAGPEE